MSLDQLAETRAREVRDQLDAITVPEPARIVRRARHRRWARTLIAAAAVAVVAAGVVVVRDNATPEQVQVATPQPGEWRIVSAETLGTGELHALVSDGTTMLAAGERLGAGVVVPTVWWSTDGIAWTPSDHPEVHDSITALAFRDGEALAVGAPGGENAFVWRSTDNGRTWTSVVEGEPFGGPIDSVPGLAVDDVPIRPNVLGLTSYDGWWVAWGAHGEGAIWISRDGSSWQRVLDTGSLGSSLTVARAADGALVAYEPNRMWRTADPASWGDPIAIELPGGDGLVAVSGDATLALGRQGSVDQPTRLLRSTDGVAWTPDETFNARYPDVRGAVVAHVADRDVVAGADADLSATALASVDAATWSQLPEALVPPAGQGAPFTRPPGVMNRVAAVGEHIVVMGYTGSDAYYFVYDVNP